MRAAQGLRRKFQTSIKEIIYDTKEIGISPKTSALSVLNCAEMLIFGNHYLDTPYSVSQHNHFSISQVLTPGIAPTESCPWSTGGGNVWFTSPQEGVRKLEHRSYFSPSSHYGRSLFLSPTTLPLNVLPNRLHSPPSLVFIVASSLT